MVVMNSTGSGENKTADKPTPSQAAAPTLVFPGKNPEVKTPVSAASSAGACADATRPHRGRRVPPPVLKEGYHCPDSTLAVKGFTNAAAVLRGGDQPGFTMVVTNIGVVACQRDVGAAPCWPPTSTRWTTTGCGEPGLRFVERDSGQDVPAWGSR